MNELQTFRNRFNEIKKAKEPVRTTRLANLMTDLEQVYNIPFLRDPKFEQKNSNVIKLYQEVSVARNLN